MGMDDSDHDDSLYLSTISETGHVPVILEHVTQFARGQGLADTDGLLLVVRELLMNAIVCGNGSDPSLMALVRVRPKSGLFEVQIDDEGEGFDFESLVLVLPEDPQTLTKRGLVLVNELSRDLTFERGGSRVKANVYPDGRSPAAGRRRMGAKV